MYPPLVVFDPLADLGPGQTLDILGGVGRSFAAPNIDKIQSARSLEQDLFVAGRIAVVTVGILVDQSSGLGVVLLLANDLLHEIDLLSMETMGLLYRFLPENQVDFGELPNISRKIGKSAKGFDAKKSNRLFKLHKAFSVAKYVKK